MTEPKTWKDDDVVGVVTLPGGHGKCCYFEDLDPAVQSKLRQTDERRALDFINGLSLDGLHADAWEVARVIKHFLIAGERKAE